MLVVLVNEPLVPTTVTRPDSGVAVGAGVEMVMELPPPPQLDRQTTSSIVKAAAKAFG